MSRNMLTFNDCILLFHDLALTVSNRLQGQCEISDKDGRYCGNGSVVFVKEISNSKNNSDPTSGWLFIGGIGVFLIYVIWDRFGKR